MEDNRGFKFILATLPILTGWLYIIGTAYFQGYQAAYGAHHSFFYLETEEILITGIVSLFSISFPSIQYAFVGLFSLVLSLFIVAIISINKKPRVIIYLWLKKIRKKTRKKRSLAQIEKLIDGSATVTSFIGYIFFILLLLLLSIISALNKGAESAKIDMLLFQQNKGSLIEIEGMKYQIVRCNTNLCLLWDGKHSRQVPREKLNNIPLNPFSPGGT